MALWERYLIAFVIGCHGITHVMFGFVVRGLLEPGALAAWTGRSWLLGNALTGDKLKGLVAMFHVAAGVVIIAGAVAIALAPSAPGWWRPLAIIGGAIGALAFAVFWDGQTQLLAEEGAIGAAISLLLLVGAIAFAGALG